MDSSVYIPVWSAIGASLITAGVSLGTVLFKERLERKRLRNATVAMLKAEIGATVKWFERHSYVSRIGEAVKGIREGNAAVFRVDSHTDLSKVFRSALPNLGLLGEKNAADIVQFYMYVEAVLDGRSSLRETYKRVERMSAAYEDKVSELEHETLDVLLGMYEKLNLAISIGNLLSSQLR